MFFCVCVDSNDNELAYLEAIHLFVEVLGESAMILRPLSELDGYSTSSGYQDSFFSNVCELDLVFHFDEVQCTRPLLSYRAHCHPQAHHILSEIIQGGLVLETNVEEIDNAGTSRLIRHSAQTTLTPAI